MHYVIASGSCLKMQLQSWMFDLKTADPSSCRGADGGSREGPQGQHHLSALPAVVHFWFPPLITQKLGRAPSAASRSGETVEVTISCSARRRKPRRSVRPVTSRRTGITAKQSTRRRPLGSGKKLCSSEASAAALPQPSNI